MIDDPVLPAAAHLTGEHASDVLAAAVSATGATLESCRPVQVQYRPGSDLIVRYSATVRRDGETVRDTLLAGTTVHGEHPGTLPVESTADTGDVVRAGVWRWPFDPVLAGLDRIVTPSLAQQTLRCVVSGPVRVEVVVYRPCERVVVRVDGDDGQQVYVKLVAPHAVADLVDRHVLLRSAGVPVPEVLATGDTWIAMTALQGPTLRELLKGDGPASGWPDGVSMIRLLGDLGAADLHHVRGPRRRLTDAAAHAAMLATVHPVERDRLGRLARGFDAHAVATADRCGPIVHGDLHEGQLIVDRGRISGVLDVDDAGPGDPVDDVANLIGHLRYRSVTTPARRQELDAYASTVRRAALGSHDATEIDVATAAALTGLATGPFRIQQADWRSSVSAVLDLAEALAGPAFDAADDERNLSGASSSSHGRVAP